MKPEYVNTFGLRKVSDKQGEILEITLDASHKYMENNVTVTSNGLENVATPADWRPGDDVIVPTAGSCGTAKERMESQNDDQYCLDWFMCFRREKK